MKPRREPASAPSSKLPRPDPVDDGVPLDPVRVRHWLGVVAGTARTAGKRDKKVAGEAVSQEHTDIAKAAECACVEYLCGTPDVEMVSGRNDGGIDGHLAAGSYDVKAVVIRSNWNWAGFGWNSIRSRGGRVVADLLIAVKVTEDMERAEIVGWARRDDPMVEHEDFGKVPSYPLRPIIGLVPGPMFWQCALCKRGTGVYVMGTDLCPGCAGRMSRAS